MSIKRVEFLVPAPMSPEFRGMAAEAWSKRANMARSHVDHGDVVRFAQDGVNLPREYRAQARRLRERLESYLKEHPEFTLRKMLLSGSLAKGTALRSLNDIDVACYIGGVDAPGDVAELLNYLAERLRRAFPNFSPDQVQAKTYSVTVSSSCTRRMRSRIPLAAYPRLTRSRPAGGLGPRR